jgi:hypothetical protein
VIFGDTVFSSCSCGLPWWQYRPIWNLLYQKVKGSNLYLQSECEGHNESFGLFINEITRYSWEKYRQNRVLWQYREARFERCVVGARMRRSDGGVAGLWA